MKNYPIFRKSLSLVVIAMLLSLPLVSITGDPDITSAKTTRTALAYTADDGGGAGDFSLIKTEPQLPLGGGLSLPEKLQLVADCQRSLQQPSRTLLPPEEISPEVPIPPNINS